MGGENTVHYMFCERNIMSQSDNSIAVARSTSTEEACALFLCDLKAWIYSCIEKYQDQPPTDGHDQLTYTTRWEPYLLSSHDEHVTRFLESAQQRTALHLTNKGAWHHGYWRTQEAHHGTEHFGAIIEISPDIEPGEYRIRAALKYQGCNNLTYLEPAVAIGGRSAKRHLHWAHRTEVRPPRNLMVRSHFRFLNRVAKVCHH